MISLPPLYIIQQSFTKVEFLKHRCDHAAPLCLWGKTSGPGIADEPFLIQCRSAHPASSQCQPCSDVSFWEPVIPTHALAPLLQCICPVHSSPACLISPPPFSSKLPRLRSILHSTVPCGACFHYSIFHTALL